MLFFILATSAFPRLTSIPKHLCVTRKQRKDQLLHLSQLIEQYYTYLYVSNMYMHYKANSAKTKKQIIDLF